MDEPAPFRSRVRGALLGLAVGDALGAATESLPRGAFPPVTDLRGGGVHGLEPGQWTDDTSMALCLAESLVERGGFDAGDQMDRYYRWYTEGHLSSTGECFGIGGTVRAALERFGRTGEPYAGSTDPGTAGNGSIMRLAPVPIFCFPDVEGAERWAAESSRTTHGAAEAVDACRLMARILCRALAGAGKQDVLFADAGAFTGSPAIAKLARGEWREKPEHEIRGTAYVVESLEAALWCFHRTGSYREAVLAATNLGDDSDTTAAVAGQIAGAYYGEKAVPRPWLERLAMRGRITDLADALTRRPGPLPNPPSNLPSEQP